MSEHNLIQMTRFCNDLHDDNKIIFCKVDFIKEEFLRIKQKENKCILIIANGDITFDDNLLSLCPDNVHHIFATNTNCYNDRVTPIPIGVEIDILPSRPGHGIINDGIFEKKEFLLNPSLTPEPIIKEKLISNFRVNTNYNLRQKIKNICNSLDYVDCYEEISFKEFSSYVKSYIGVISPRGNGIECIRTYETLYLGGIPIVVGPINDYKAINEKIYKNLPVVYIDDENKLKDFVFIKNEIEKIKNNSRETLKYDYWLNLIKNKSLEI
jgi:hypothetical protein